MSILYSSDVISIEKTGENFRLLYDVKGRFTVHRISPEEARVSGQLSRDFIVCVYVQKKEMTIRCH